LELTMQTTSDAVASADGDAAESTYLAYRIGCGSWQLAVDAQWTTGILDSYALQAIPRAPQWMVGCTNVDGLLVPVIDLVLLLDSAAASARGVGQRPRMLLGSHSPGANEEAIGLLFTGLPQQVAISRSALPANFEVPPLLRRMARGLAEAPDGRTTVELDTHSLIDHLIRQLDTPEHASA
jgi:chemotaxis signal transduction protein